MLGGRLGERHAPIRRWKREGAVVERKKKGLARCLARGSCCLSSAKRVGQCRLGKAKAGRLNPCCRDNQWAGPLRRTYLGMDRQGGVRAGAAVLPCRGSTDPCAPS